MTPRPLNAILQALADTGPPESDAALLKRFATTRCDEAFSRLVQRHGRLVWAVCRHLCRSDAEADDAFQATFVVLLRSAGKLKDAGKLSAWLHGVAYKVCGKARQAKQRRTKREAAVATHDRTGPAVPDSAWERALAAVHEEVAGLPDTLRVPFVLCCLEGKGQTEAAEQLGWKLGTLSGRLTRAKDAVLAKLNARGLTLGVLAGLGLGGVPAAVTAKAMELASAAGVIPAGILQLSSGVIGMGVSKVKLLAAGVLVACGVAVSGGAGLVTRVEAQAPAKAVPADRVKQLEAELAKAKADAARAEADANAAAKKEVADFLAREMAATEKARNDVLDVLSTVTKAPEKKGEPAAGTKKWDYDFVATSDMPRETFVGMLQEWENKGWEFVGTTPMADKPMWVFRKPKGGAKLADLPGGYRYEYYTSPAVPVPMREPKPAPPWGGLYSPPTATVPAQSDDPKAIEAEIKRLQKKLDDLKAQPKPKGELPKAEPKDPNLIPPPAKPVPPVPPTPPVAPVAPANPNDTQPNPKAPTAKVKPAAASFSTSKLPLDAEETAALLMKRAVKKFGKESKVQVVASGDMVLVYGDNNEVEWAQGVIDGLRK